MSWLSNYWILPVKLTRSLPVTYKQNVSVKQTITHGWSNQFRGQHFSYWFMIRWYEFEEKRKAAQSMWGHLEMVSPSQIRKNVDVDTIKKRQIICNLNLLIQAITKRTLRECQLMNVCSISDIFKQLWLRNTFVYYLFTLFQIEFSHCKRR